MEPTEQEKAQSEINAILNDKSHAMYERFHRSDPEAITYVNKLWERTAVQQPETPPPPPTTPQIGNTSGQGQPPGVDPGAIAAQKSDSDVANEQKLATDHLIQTLGASEAGITVKDAREVFGRLFERNNDGDQAMLAQIETSIGNDPTVILHLASLKGKLAGLGPSLDGATVARMSHDEKLGRAVSATVALFGSLESPLVKRLEKLFPDELSQAEAINWLASKNFR